MSEEVTVSVPYYNCEFTMPWERYKNSLVSEFIQAIIEKATEGLRFARLILQPEFTLYIPGRENIANDSIVSSSLRPDCFVLLLASDTIAARGLTMSNPPANVDRLPVLQGTSVERTLDVINSRYQQLITHGTRAPTRTHPILPPLLQGHAESTDDEDEEYVQRESLATDTNGVVRTLQLMNAMLGMSAPVMSGVKKVLNMDTFNRVCPVISADEIRSLSTTQVESDLPSGDDIVGGPDDAGLGACSVCLSLLVDRTKAPVELRKMPNCVHIFHAACLSEWLTRNAITCPVCREPAVTEARDYGYLGYGPNEDAYTPALASRERDIPTWVPRFP